MTTGIECKGCCGDSRFCRCEYQQEIDRMLRREAESIMKALDEMGLPYYLSRSANEIALNELRDRHIAVSVKDIAKWWTKHRRSCVKLTVVAETPTQERRVPRSRRLGPGASIRRPK